MTEPRAGLEAGTQQIAATIGWSRDGEPCRDVAAPDVRLARAYLVRVAEPPAPALGRFVAQHGSVVAAERVAAGEVPKAVAAETSARRGLRLAERDLTTAADFGARLVVPEDEEWPAWPLLSLDLAARNGARDAVQPLALWVRGTVPLDELVQGAIAMVGARAATGYGERVTADWAYELAGAGVPIFSGAAYGIDGAAHRGALAGHGRTAAVLGCGLDAGYPAGHARLLEQIAEAGAVISEYPPGTPPARHRFLVRNRLIAALSEGTVVVEAGLRSGARNTASVAGVLGKMVMAAPGPVSSTTSAGCHEMIRSLDATLVASSEHILDTVGHLRAGPASSSGRAPRRTDGLGPDELRVHEALSSRKGRSPEEVATSSGVSLDRVRAVLPALELDGLTVRDETGWRLTPNTEPAKGRGDA